MAVDETPKHKAFLELANEGYWDDYTFNRVIENFSARGCPILRKSLPILFIFKSRIQ